MSWPMVKLRKLVVANYGKALKKEVRDENGDIEVFGSAGLVGFHNESLFEQQTIVIGRKGSVGKVIWAPKGGWVIDTAYYLTVKENVVLDWRYLFYVLQNVRLDSKTITTSIPGLNRDDFYDTEIPLPPIEQQKRIAAILDKADAIRQKRKQAIALADEFLRSVFLDMFGDPVTNPKGWDTGSMADFGEFKNGLNYSRDESGVELSYIGVGDFKSHSKLESIEKLSTIQLNENPDDSYLLKDNDLLFVRSNGNRALVGRCLTVHPREKKVTFSGFCIRYRVQRTEKLNPTFVNYCMRMPSMKNAMLKGGQGANIQNINQKTLISLLLPIPPQELQKGFEDLVNQYQRFSERSLVGSNADDALFLSLSQKAFSGQL